MQRRDFITLLGGTVATWSVAARAQQAGKVWRIGSLSPGSSGQSENLKAFMQGLNDLGYIDGKNIQFERRVAEGHLDRLPALAAELVLANVDVILAESSFAVEAAQAATKTIPIVMTGVGNPVGSGFVKSISQPGGNITGLTNDSIEVSSKYLEYLRAAVPNLMRVGVIIDPKHPNHPTVLKQVGWRAGDGCLGLNDRIALCKWPRCRLALNSTRPTGCANRAARSDVSQYLPSNCRVRDRQSAAHHVWAKARS